MVNLSSILVIAAEAGGFRACLSYWVSLPFVGIICAAFVREYGETKKRGRFDRAGHPVGWPCCTSQPDLAAGAADNLHVRTYRRLAIGSGRLGFGRIRPLQIRHPVAAGE